MKKLRRVDLEPPKKGLSNGNIKVFKDFICSHPRKMALGRENHLALGIFEFLKLHMDKDNAVQCSSKVLEEFFEVSRVTISRCISVLKKHKFITVKKKGTSNVYYIDKTIVVPYYNNDK